MSKILSDIRTLVLGDPECSEFDPELIMNINSALNRLQLLGVGIRGYRIVSGEEEWSEFVSDMSRFENIKTYVYMKVKMVFDPPSTASVQASYERMISEAEWLLNSEAEVGDAYE